MRRRALWGVAHYAPGVLLLGVVVPVAWRAHGTGVALTLLGASLCTLAAEYGAHQLYVRGYWYGRMDQQNDLYRTVVKGQPMPDPDTIDPHPSDPMPQPGPRVTRQ